MRATAQPGELVTGFYSAWGTGPGYTSDTVRFAQPLPGVPTSVTVLPFAGPYTASCPAVGAAAVGAACVYVNTASNVTSSSVFDPATGSNSSVTARGFGLYFSCGAAGGCYSYGVWAVRPPA